MLCLQGIMLEWADSSGPALPRSSWLHKHHPKSVQGKKYILISRRGGGLKKILYLKLFQVAATTVPTSLLAERQEKHTEDCGCCFKLHEENHGACVLSLQARVVPLWIRSDGLEWLQELSANIYTAARSNSSNLSGMLWQFLASAMRTAGHASMRDFKVETWSLNRKGHPDYIIFCRIGRKNSDDKALTLSWRFCILLYFLGHPDASVFSGYVGTAAFRLTENKASVSFISEGY